MARFPRGMWLLCAIPFALQGCGGGGGTETGPAPKPAKLSNPDNTAAQLQALTAPFQTAAFQNFAALHQHFGPAGSALGDAIAHGGACGHDRRRGTWSSLAEQARDLA